MRCSFAPSSRRSLLVAWRQLHFTSSSVGLVAPAPAVYAAPAPVVENDCTNAGCELCRPGPNGVHAAHPPRRDHSLRSSSRTIFPASVVHAAPAPVAVTSLQRLGARKMCSKLQPPRGSKRIWPLVQNDFGVPNIATPKTCPASFLQCSNSVIAMPSRRQACSLVFLEKAIVQCSNKCCFRPFESECPLLIDGDSAFRQSTERGCCKVAS